MTESISSIAKRILSLQHIHSWKLYILLEWVGEGQEVWENLPIQPLGPPLKPRKLYLLRFSTNSGAKLSGFQVMGFSYTFGSRWTIIGGTIMTAPLCTLKLLPMRMVKRLWTRVMNVCLWTLNEIYSKWMVQKPPVTIVVPWETAWESL